VAAPKKTKANFLCQVNLINANEEYLNKADVILKAKKYIRINTLFNKD
jgi:hypothetical protein